MMMMMMMMIIIIIINYTLHSVKEGRNSLHRVDSKEGYMDLSHLA